MTRKPKALIAAALTLALLGGGSLAAESIIASQIETRIKSELPKATGISASISLIEMVQSLFSDSIKSANIKIDSYALKGNTTETSIEIAAKSISKSKPTIIGSLEVISTIPAATILQSAEFGDAEIVDNTLQISAGPGGLGRAILVPKFSDNQIYFEIKGISLFGNEIPASSLPADAQSQIKEKSLRQLDIPKGMKLISVSLNTQGLSVTLRGTNIQLETLGSSL
jgi:DNA-binding protein